ncbi:MAG: NAAT family transporter [Gammaproteobacteria bacterium]|nr:MAG: NAAT family transporter [Gammaproteobacteria bacterium]
MEQYTQGIMTVLSLVNPVICGMLFSQTVSGKPRSAQIIAATQAILAILVILWLAAIGGAYLLKAFGISLDAFQAAGGMVLAWMGFLMLRGVSSPTTGSSESHAEVSLTPLILFAASPGTITGVITLSVAHAGSGLPVTVLVSVAVALTITWLVMVVVTHSTAQKKQSLMHDVSTRFMGLIVLAMGMQFSLTGLKAFFAA